MTETAQESKNKCAEYTAQLFDRFNYVYDRPSSIDKGRIFYGIHRNYGAENQYKGSLYDHRGKLVPTTLRFNAGDIVPADPERLPANLSFKGVSEQTLYGGSLFPILGHFLVETLGRLWPLLQYKTPIQLYFHHWPGLDVEAFKSNTMYQHIFAALGSDIKSLRLIDEEIKFSNMMLPDAMSIYHSYMHPGMNMIYDKIIAFSASNTVEKSSKIFLSRSRWQENRRIHNEAMLDEIFDRLGYKIIYPEEMEAGALIQTIGGADFIAATDGSHAHLISFAAPGTRFISLDTRIIPTQVALAALRGAMAFHIPFHRSVFFDVKSKNLIDLNGLENLITQLNDVDFESTRLNGEKMGSRYDEAWSIYRML